MTGRHDYPELSDAKPAPVEQTTCPYCAGSGWKETHLDDNGIGHGWKCFNCAGRGYVWTEQQQELHKQAAEARRRLTRARYLP